MCLLRKKYKMKKTITSYKAVYGIYNRQTDRQTDRMSQSVYFVILIKIVQYCVMGVGLLYGIIYEYGSVYFVLLIKIVQYCVMGVGLMGVCV